VNESADKILRANTEENNFNNLGDNSKDLYKDQILESNEENMEDDLNKNKNDEIAMLEEIMRAKNPVKCIDYLLNILYNI